MRIAWSPGAPEALGIAPPWPELPIDDDSAQARAEGIRDPDCGWMASCSPTSSSSICAHARTHLSLHASLLSRRAPHAKALHLSGDTACSHHLVPTHTHICGEVMRFEHSAFASEAARDGTQDAGSHFVMRALVWGLAWALERTSTCRFGERTRPRRPELRIVKHVAWCTNSSAPAEVEIDRRTMCVVNIVFGAFVRPRAAIDNTKACWGCDAFRERTRLAKLGHVALHSTDAFGDTVRLLRGLSTFGSSPPRTAPGARIGVELRCREPRAHPVVG